MKLSKANISQTKSRHKLWQTFPILLLYILLLALPCCLKIGPQGGFHFAKSWLLTGLLGSILPATICWLLSYKYKWCKILISTILWILFILDFFLFFHFETRITDRIIFLVMQTNSREANEFLSTYIFTGATVKALIIAIILAIAYKIIRNFANHIQYGTKTQKYLTTGLIIGNIFSIATLILSAFTNILVNAGANNTIQGLYVACNEASSYSADVSRLEKAMKRCDSSVDASIYSSDSIPDIIFIIGESYNPNHSPLYGYRMMTTPGLVKERDLGNLSVYADVITPYSATGKMMEVYYSPADAYANSEKWDIPLVPSLYKHAGYVVTIHDNQCTRIVGDSKWDVGNCQFLNSNVIENASMDYRNKDIMADDLLFCQRELSVMQAIKAEQKKPMFSIIHLYGQHSPAVTHYPENCAHFTPDDYTWRKNITAQQAEEIAAYDNATLYNDSVVCTVLHAVEHQDAIVVYVSDHGEEVHDYRNQYGRTLGPITRGIAENIYRVPLMIYTTPKFREYHTNIMQQIKSSVSKKVFTGDVSQMLLYLGGLKTQWLDTSRVPMLPTYTSAARRILQGDLDYDATYN